MKALESKEVPGLFKQHLVVWTYGDYEFEWDYGNLIFVRKFDGNKYGFVARLGGDFTPSVNMTTEELIPVLTTRWQLVEKIIKNYIEENIPEIRNDE